MKNVTTVRHICELLVTDFRAVGSLYKILIAVMEASPASSGVLSIFMYVLEASCRCLDLLTKFATTTLPILVCIYLMYIVKHYVQRNQL